MLCATKMERNLGTVSEEGSKSGSRYASLSIVAGEVCVEMDCTQCVCRWIVRNAVWEVVAVVRKMNWITKGKTPQKSSWCV